MKKKEISSLPEIDSNKAVTSNSNNVGHSTILPIKIFTSAGARWLKFYEQELDYGNTTLLISGSSTHDQKNETYIASVSFSGGIVNVGFSNIGSSSAVGILFMKYKITGGKLEMWTRIANRTHISVICLTCNYFPIEVIGDPPGDAITIS